MLNGGLTFERTMNKMKLSLVCLTVALASSEATHLRNRMSDPFGLTTDCGEVQIICPPGQKAKCNEDGTGGECLPAGEFEARGSGGVPCGDNMCPPALECCNSSCGMCVPPGTGCAGVVCDDEEAAEEPTEAEESEERVTCGPNVCSPGKECCNPSCGICVEPGGGCIDIVCKDPNQNDPPPPPGGEKCRDNICGEAEYCCNPSCGICAPEGGGCIKLFCGEDKEPPPRPVTCGSNTCAAGEECCNESCGICGPPGGGCTTQFCEEEP